MKRHEDAQIFRLAICPSCFIHKTSDAFSASTDIYIWICFQCKSKYYSANIGGYAVCIKPDKLVSLENIL